MNHFLEKVRPLVMPLHEELFRDVEKRVKEKKLRAYPGNYSEMYTLSRI